MNEINMTNMHFNVGIAKCVGVDGAIMINNLHYWIIKNKANEKHFYDGKYWTYNSLEAFMELFPFWSKRQIERILKNLKKDGYIEDGNYNKVAYDRTKWYTLTEKGWFMISQNGDMSNFNISPNGEMENTEWGNGNHETVTPIPNQKPNKKKKEEKEITFDKIIETYTSNDSLKERLIDFIKMRKAIKSPMTNRALTILVNKLDKLATSDEEKIMILDESILNSWKGVFPLKKDKPNNQNSNNVNNEPRYDKNGFEIV